MRRILSAVLAVLSSAASAAPITLTTTGIWETPSTSPNFRIMAGVESDQTDSDPRTQVGLYAVQDLAFHFSELGKFKTPFSLFADADSTKLEISLSDDGSGELHYFGSMLSTYTFPNGSPPTTFDMRLWFRTLEDTSLSSLSRLGEYEGGMLYLTDGNSARSSRFLTSSVDVQVQTVPEPNSAALSMLGVLVLLSSRRKRMRSGG